MHWHDHHPPSRPDQWAGLALTVERRGRASLCVEAAPGVLRIAVGGRPRVWARLAPHFEGVWWLRDDAPPAVLPPLTASAGRSVGTIADGRPWLAGWARVFARQLLPLIDGGSWLLAPVRGPGLARFEGVHAEWPSAYDLADVARQPHHGFADWGVNGSGAVLGLRALSPIDAPRVRALRKRARDGTLAPLLLTYVSGLDMHLLLDGHDRLRAALAEGREIAALTLYRVRRVRYAVDETAREALWQSVGRAFGRMPETPRLTLDRLNQRLVDGFADPVYARVVTRAWPLPGGAARWRQEAAAHAPDWAGLDGRAP